MDGLLGVAGMIMKLVMTGIIPENSLRLAPVRLVTAVGFLCGNDGDVMVIFFGNLLVIVCNL